MIVRREKRGERGDIGGESERQGGEKKRQQEMREIDERERIEQE